MPPALSDVESSASEAEDIPHRAKGAVDKDMDDAPEDEDEDEEGGDEFVVEKIISHQFIKGELLFEVKWLGYEKKADRTWEPEENLETAQETLKDYFDSIGGRPSPPAKGKKRKQSDPSTTLERTASSRGRKKARASPSATGTPDTSSKPKSKRGADEFKPPAGSWEHEVSLVETVEEIPNAQGERVRYGYIMWNSQKKTKHPLKVLNLKCPQKMLQYYEQHLVFKTNSLETTNGEGGMMEDAVEEGEGLVEDD